MLRPENGNDQLDGAARKQKEEQDLSRYFRQLSTSGQRKKTDFSWPYDPLQLNLDGYYHVDMQLHFFPDSITLHLPHLTSLNLGDNSIAEIPPCISRLTALTELRFDSVPSSLRGNRIASLPRQLRCLRMSNNSLITLPNEIGNLSNLEQLWLNNNMLVSLPAQLGDLAALKQLIICDNLLTSLPSSLSALKLNLKSFNVAGNRLIYPPPEAVQNGMKAILTYLYENPIVEGSTIGADLSIYLTNAQFTDLELQSIDGVVIHVHKALLHAWSEGKAECRWKTQNEDKVCITVDASSATLRSFVQWVYTEGCRPVGLQEVSTLLHWFSIPHVLDAGIIRAVENKSLPEQLATLWKNPLYSSLTSKSDVTLRIGQSRVPAHKFVLCCRASYFHAMLAGQMKEASEAEITLEENGKEVEVLVQYLYSGQAEEYVSEDILECAIVAHKFGVDGLLRSLETLIQQGMDPENAVSIIHMCEMYSMPRLLGIAAFYAAHNWPEVCDSADWANVSATKHEEIKQAGKKLQKERESREVPAPLVINPAPAPAARQANYNAPTNSGNNNNAHVRVHTVGQRQQPPNQESAPGCLLQ